MPPAGRRKTTAQVLTTALISPVNSIAYSSSKKASKRATRALVRRTLNVLSGDCAQELLNDLNSDPKTAVPVNDLVAEFERLATDDANACCRHGMRRALLKLLLRSRPKAKYKDLVDLGMVSLSRHMFTDVRGAQTPQYSSTLTNETVRQDK